MVRELLVDTPNIEVHTLGVGGLPNRLSIPDARGTGAYLRVTRHPDQQKVVVSHWRDSVCVASTPVDIGELPSLIGVLAEAIGDAVVIGRSAPVGDRTAPSDWARVKGWFRPTLAKVLDLRMRSGKGTQLEHPEAE